MSIANLPVGNGLGYTTADLSIGKKAQTARMPVPTATVANARDGEFHMKTGDRPWFWYFGRWNPMASTYDLPAAAYHAEGFAYQPYHINIPENSEIVLNDSTGFTPVDIDNISYTDGNFYISTSGYYQVTIQVRLTGLSTYFTQNYKVYMMSTLNGGGLSSTGWDTGYDTRDGVTQHNSIVRYMNAGDYVGCRVGFFPESSLGSGGINAYGESSGYFGFDTYLQVTYISDSPALRRKKMDEHDAALKAEEEARLAAEAAAAVVIPCAKPASVSGVKPIKPPQPQEPPQEPPQPPTPSPETIIVREDSSNVDTPFSYAVESIPTTSGYSTPRVDEHGCVVCSGFEVVPDPGCVDVTQDMDSGFIRLENVAECEAEQ